MFRLGETIRVGIVVGLDRANDRPEQDQADQACAHRDRAAKFTLAAAHALCCRVLPACVGRSGAASAAPCFAQCSRSASRAIARRDCARSVLSRGGPSPVRRKLEHTAQQSAAIDALINASGIRAAPAVRSHGQRQDRGLPERDRAQACGGSDCAGVAAGAGDQSDAATRIVVARTLPERVCSRIAQQPRGHRTRRRMVGGA